MDTNTSISTNKGLELRLDMKDNRKCIAISLPILTWDHSFLNIEANLGSVYRNDKLKYLAS